MIDSTAAQIVDEPDFGFAILGFDKHPDLAEDARPYSSDERGLRREHSDEVRLNLALELRVGLVSVLVIRRLICRDR